MRIAPLLVIATATAAVSTRPAHACSPPPCLPGSFSLRASSTVPANLPGVVWVPASDFTSSGTSPDDPTKVTMTVIGTGTAIPVTITPFASGGFFVVPTQPLVVGTTYQIVDANVCASEIGGGTSGPVTSFVVAAAADPPSTLGTLTSSPQPVGALDVGTANGMCTTEVQADRAPVDLTLAADAAPWRDVLQFTTLIDGAAYGTASRPFETAPDGTFVSRGAASVYRVCSGGDATVSEGWSLGDHQLGLAATIPGSPTRVEVAAVTVALSCTAEDGGDDGDTTDGDPTDGDPVDPTDDGGCSTGPSTPAWPVLGALALLLPMRRRRR